MLYFVLRLPAVGTAGSARSCWRKRVAVGVAGVAVGAATGVAAAPPANATAMKTNRVILSAAAWLGGGGVSVYSNDRNYGSDPSDLNYVNGVLSGYRWQCVELVNRLYLSHGWIAATWRGNGTDMYRTAPANLGKEPNGSITSVGVGDVVSFGGGSGSLGHAAIVDSVTGSGTIRTLRTISQNLSNADDSYAANFTWDTVAKTISHWSGYTTNGIIHAPPLHSGSLTAIRTVTASPSNPHMYQPITYSYTVQNTTSGGASIQRLAVAVRGPAGDGLDAVCADGTGVTLAAGQTWTCTATVPTGYGSQGGFTYWADWLGYDGAWHQGELGPDQRLSVGPPNTLSISQPIFANASGAIPMFTAIHYTYRVWNTSGAPASIRKLIVAVRGPSGNNLDLTCAGGSGVTLTAGQEWTCTADVPQGYGQQGTFTFWADWQDYNGYWHAGQLGANNNLIVV